MLTHTDMFVHNTNYPEKHIGTQIMSAHMACVTGNLASFPRYYELFQLWEKLGPFFYRVGIILSILICWVSWRRNFRLWVIYIVGKWFSKKKQIRQKKASIFQGKTIAWIHPLMSGDHKKVIYAGSCKLVCIYMLIKIKYTINLYIYIYSIVTLKVY